MQIAFITLLLLTSLAEEVSILAVSTLPEAIEFILWK